MKLSIVIPTLSQTNEKGEKYIDNVIQNIKDLELDFDYEVIVIKDKLVNEAWNEGVHKAKGEYVFIINDDIIIYDGTIERLISICDVYGMSCPYYTTLEDYERIHAKGSGGIVGFAFMMNRECIDRWFPIPDRFKIWFGDNWIHEKNNKRFAWGGRIHHFESRTVLGDEHRERIDVMIEEDKLEWDLHLKEIEGLES